VGEVRLDGWGAAVAITAEPAVIAYLDTPAQISALAVAGSYLYVANQSGGLLIVQAP
jgi:hypothetical protein